jgi:acyl-CoA thioester hydrolase
MKPIQKNKANYIFFKNYATRWRDNDVYGHMNNVVFYEFVDSIVNCWLVERGGLKVPNSKLIGLVVHTECNYFSELGFPKPVTCGLRVEKIGSTSVTYGVGLFNSGENLCAAQVTFVHAYVDSINRNSINLPANLVKALSDILIN